MPFSQRTPAQQLDGIGLRPGAREGRRRAEAELRHLEYYTADQRADGAFVSQLRAAVTPDPAAFDPLPPPGEWDWLTDRNGVDQPFHKFAQTCARRRPPPESQLYLLPVAEDPSDLSAFPPLPALQSAVSAFFCMPAVVLPATGLAQLARGRKPVRSRRQSEGGRAWHQYHAGDILQLLRPQKRPGAHTLCAFTMHDIYKSSFNFLFGLASLSDGVGVFSFVRQDPAFIACEFWNGTDRRQGPADEAKLLRRATATLCHEIGHTFGLKHCT
eukprot:SAG22_NODE_184_length_15968_cov_39.081858_12_plen_271_part_00